MKKNEEKVGYLIKRSQQELRSRMDAVLEELGITITQYSILSALTEEKGLSNADLARKSFVTPQTMHRTLKTMEKKGLIKSTPNAQNRRIIDFTITARGASILVKADKKVDQVEVELYAGLAKEEVDTLGKLLEKLVKSLGP